ncbi:MAG: hypothetical protein ACPG4T_23830 [Nannocystaceae bacterium]
MTAKRQDAMVAASSVRRACWVPVALLAWLVWMLTLTSSNHRPPAAEGCVRTSTPLMAFHFEAGHPVCRVKPPVATEVSGPTSAPPATGGVIVDDEDDEPSDHIDALNDSYGVLGP